MGVTSGFFNSLNNDRLYNADQFNSLFDVLYNDGIFQNTGNGFEVTAPGSSIQNTVYVGTGEAWFDNSWIKNDEIMTVTLSAPHTTLGRYDAIVLDINTTSSVRENKIMVVDGTAASSPEFPTLINESHHKQHPLAYILRDANTSVVVSAKITDKRGQSTTTPPTPWVSLKMSSDITLFTDTINAFRNIGYAGGDNLNGLLKFTGETLTSIDLLWVNSSPTTYFGDQTISLNLANYDAVLVYFRISPSKTMYFCSEIALVQDASTTSENMLVTQVHSDEESNGNYLYQMARWFYAITTGVHFTIPYWHYYHTTGWETAFSCMTPFKIYGIKGIGSLV